GGGAGTGGAGGCGGATCNLACKYGFMTDPNNGCPECACNPPPACTATECGPAPPYAYPSCPSGEVNPAACTRDTSGTCAWHAPTCVPCPAYVCPAIACPVSQGAQPQSAVPPSGCPTCTCTPVST
ncbi:MAG TPA: hypothetical protein VMT47_07185, partial [Polyangia bacterium]|nr:hypothetical protein [Polyangia bacterium]